MADGSDEFGVGGTTEDDDVADHGGGGRGWGEEGWEGRRWWVFRGEGYEGGRGLKDGEETLFVNAAVMDVDYRPVNAPWVVDLDLPRAGGDRL